jgi:hypothetical protein
MTQAFLSQPTVSCPCGNPHPIVLGVRDGIAVIECCECLLAHTVRLPSPQIVPFGTTASRMAPARPAVLLARRNRRDASYLVNE